MGNGYQIAVEDEFYFRDVIGKLQQRLRELEALEDAEMATEYPESAPTEAEGKEV